MRKSLQRRAGAYVPGTEIKLESGNGPCIILTLHYKNGPEVWAESIVFPNFIEAYDRLEDEVARMLGNIVRYAFVRSS